MSYASALRTGYGTGHETELVSVWRGARAPGGVALIGCHGYGATALQAYDSGIARIAGAADVVCVWPDLGLGDLGKFYWAHTDVTGSGGAIDDAIAWSASVYGTDPDRAAIYGTSMGGGAIGWCWRNPTKLVAAAFTIPSFALQSIHDTDPLGIGIAASMETRYGGLAALVAAYPSNDPSHPNNTALLVPLADRIRVWYSGNDAVIDPATVTAFAAATGIEATNIGNVGHSEGTAIQSVADWLLPRLWWA